MKHLQSPWLEVPLLDYERHMDAPSVAQASMIAETLRQLVKQKPPQSLGLLGSTGGNGLDQIDPAVTRRVVTVDINPEYLEVCRERHAKRFDSFEQVNCDLSKGCPFTEPVELVYAALVLEYIDLDAFLNYAPSLVTKNGRIAFVFQNRDKLRSPVSDTGISMLLPLAKVHLSVNVDEVANQLLARGMSVDERRAMQTPSGKLFTLLVMTKH
jgi:hypothetical protein